MATKQLGFYVDTTRCIKCWACVITCKQWHDIKAGTVSRRNVEEENGGSFPNVTRKFTSLSCMHCENPGCVAVCPTGAVSKREEDGLVVVDQGVCIGCKTCASGCPFGVPQYLDMKMNKCDACLTLREAEGDLPRCVITCPCQALHFGELEEMGRLAAEKGGKLMEGSTKPSVYIA
ncbi:MAG: 4Fe-4S dicluster domain-containing protein [Coriobacteriaceae bacterium]|jgi:DMSO reductase iron-sulfur subunit|nr:4Fe-4S dicluster domain-containing protein [Coriobacteriaceae bacterium]